MITIDAKQHAYFKMSIIALAVMAYIVQSMLFLNADVASLLFDTKLFLAGGTYAKDFFETNPPMIFMIYSPASILSDLTSFDITICIRVYIIFLSLISLICCWTLLNKVIENDDYRLRYAIIYTLTFLFLLMPADEFGQREHMLMILIMPYLFGVVASFQNKRINIFLACYIGFTAGMGFGLKPYFLPALVFIEFYLIIAKRNLFGWVRVESVICASILVIYLAFVYFFHPNYFNIMLPLISHLYYVSIKQSWLIIFTRPLVIFCLMVVGYYCFFYHKKQYYRELTQVLVLALIGMILAFIIPLAAWRYHVFPAVAVSCVLITIYIFQVFSVKLNNGSLSTKEIIFLAMAGFVFPIYSFFTDMTNAIKYKRENKLYLLIKSINDSKIHSIYCFSSHTTGYCFPLVYMANKEFAGRFPFFWWLRGLIKLEKKSPEYALPAFIQQDKNYLIEAIANDLNDYRPDLIVIHENDEKIAVGDNFSYIAYFSENKQFQEAWKHYSYSQSAGGVRFYKRISTDGA